MGRRSHQQSLTKRHLRHWIELIARLIYTVPSLQSLNLIWRNALNLLHPLPIEFFSRELQIMLKVQKERSRVEHNIFR